MSPFISAQMLEHAERIAQLHLRVQDGAERLYFDAYDDDWKSLDSRPKNALPEDINLPPQSRQLAPIPLKPVPSSGPFFIQLNKLSAAPHGDTKASRVPAVTDVRQRTSGDLIFGPLSDQIVVVRGADKLPIAVDVKDGVSAQFASDVKTVLSSMPRNILKALDDAHYRYVVADRLTNAIPSLKGSRPRGWPADTTWDNAEGTQSPKKRLIVIAEYALNRRGELFKVGRMPGVLRHETGHAVDVALAKGGQIFSQSDSFKAAYERDLNNISASDRQALYYFLQAGDTGRSETFADVFALRMGGPVNERDREALKRAFPGVLELIDKTIKDLPRN